MYKILIAEDSSLIRRGIISMIQWEQHNCTLAGEAENGKEALKMLESIKPDILLLDVKMPYIDGMKILDYISEQNISVLTIVISGYSNFEYVKHALHSNTIDYILKPIHEEELNHAIVRACERINTSQKSQTVSEQTLQSHRLQSALEENAYSTFSDVFTSAGNHTCFWFASLQNKYNNYAFFIEKIILLNHPTLKTSLVERPDRLDIIFYSELSDDYDESLKILQRLYTQADSILKNLLYIGISSLHPSDFIISKACYEAHKALCNKMLHPDHSILTYRQYSDREYNMKDVFQAELPLLDYIMSGDNTNAVLLCQNVINQHLSNPEVTLDEFCMLLTELYCTLSKTGTSHMPELQQEISLLHNFDNLRSYDSTVYLIETFYQYCRQISTEILLRRTDIETSILEIKNYIEHHFCDSISLKTLESLFHINASYISVCFKKTIGTGINKYVRNLRLDYAKNLLETTNYKLSDISKKSGYTDYVHFSKEFKKHTGYSPSDYRTTNKK